MFSLHEIAALLVVQSSSTQMDHIAEEVVALLDRDLVVVTQHRPDMVSLTRRGREVLRCLLEPPQFRQHPAQPSSRERRRSRQCRSRFPKQG
jgi:DNA-binding MarR family transcriptional regulator